MKAFLKQYIGDLFFSRRWYTLLTACSLLFLLRFFLPWLGLIPYLALSVVGLLFVVDYYLLFSSKGLWAGRSHADRFSNGDENGVRIDLQNFYPFAIHTEIIDEIPDQFQKRDVLFKTGIGAKATGVITYKLRPVKRGEYQFGRINVFANTLFNLAKRRFQFGGSTQVAVYPSFLQMRKYQLMATHNELNKAGVKKVRRIGHSMEYEQIKEWVAGDDYRTVNWKATARRGQVMVNHYTDERSQQVYCIIDKGRVMKMPFEGLSLLDYAINSSLVLLNVALVKGDRAGLVTFSEKINTMVPADKKAVQMQLILENLYHQKTRYLESDYERLYTYIRSKIKQRSLIVLYTNFESLSGLRRQLPYLRKIATHHLLLVIFFENTELHSLTMQEAKDLESIYVKTIAEKFAYEKKMIVKELQQYGILSLLTAPENLTVNTINKYLELKARQAI
ncbi:MAG: DUF58 domain-containing protein [Williamsia sp.]|nr:DUF58 domain-containing protein [Williamsia sp.]